MGHSPKKKSVTRKFALLKIDSGNYEVGRLGAEYTTDYGFNVDHVNDVNQDFITNFCQEHFEKRVGIKLHKGEIAEMIVTIKRK